MNLESPILSTFLRFRISLFAVSDLIYGRSRVPDPQLPVFICMVDRKG